MSFVAFSFPIFLLWCFYFSYWFVGIIYIFFIDFLSKNIYFYMCNIVYPFNLLNIFFLLKNRNFFSIVQFYHFSPFSLALLESYLRFLPTFGHEDTFIFLQKL